MTSSTGRRGVAVALSAAVVAVVALSACGPVQKQAAVKRVAAAARRPGLRTGTLTISTKLLSTTGLASFGVSVSTVPPSLKALAGALGRGAPAAPPSLRIVLDVATDRAALLAPPAAAARIGGAPSGQFPALAIFDGSLVSVRSPNIGEVGEPPWQQLDTAKSGPVVKATTDVLQQPRTLGDLAVLSPDAFVREGLGLLTGSVAIKGTTTVVAPDGGAPQPAVEYAGNTSLDKVFRTRHLDPSKEKPTQYLLRSFAAHDDINPITVWLDPQGNLLRLRVVFTGRPEFGIKFATTYDLVLDPPGTTVDPSVLLTPPKEQVVRLSALDDLRSALDQWATVKPGAAVGSGT